MRVINIRGLSAATLTLVLSLTGRGGFTTPSRGAGITVADSFRALMHNTSLVINRGRDRGAAGAASTGRNKAGSQNPRLSRGLPEVLR